MKIKRFKLNLRNALSAESLRQKEMSAIMGGKSCGCSCYYANNGGSSSNDNNMANYNYGYSSSEGCNQYSYSDEMGDNYWPEALHA